MRARVAGVGVLEGGPGSVTKGATVQVSPVELARVPKMIDGVEVGSVGTGLLVDVGDGRIKAPLTVTFPRAAAPAGSSMVGVHRTDGGRFDLVPAGQAAGGGLVVVTDRFSIVSWAVAEIFKPVGDFLAAKLAGRSSPPECQGIPAWASVDGSPSGSTHSCVRAGASLGDGTEIAELEIKSNRGAYQWVELPAEPGREYVWVEDQNDLVRAMIRTTFGRGEAILLGPGQRMTIGYRQPVAPAQLSFRTSVDTLSGVLSMGRLAIDAATGDTIDKTGGYIAVLSCFGTLKIDLTNLDDPVQVTSPQLLTSLVPCAIKKMQTFYRDPSQATAAAGSLLGNEANTGALTAISQDLFTLGRYAKVFTKAIELGTYIFKELAFITDALTTGFGALNATTVTLTLNAKPPPVESFYGTWWVHGGGAEFRPDGTGRAWSHDGFTDDGGWIDQVETLSTRLSPDGTTLTVTIVEVYWEVDGEARITNPTPQYSPGFVAGDSFTVTFEHPRLLKVSALRAQSPDSSFGNPYLCGDGLAAEFENLCGA